MYTFESMNKPGFNTLCLCYLYKIFNVIIGTIVLRRKQYPVHLRKRQDSHIQILSSFNIGKRMKMSSFKFY